ncbi:stereospecific carbonyl reductase 2 [Nadsonia fulvescens var. elongata DSM 6958]|uniref:Stereospecific carbonyl reductase 2 n=1 Tax=Nadsonia fulvescens var. elongata DSM 6958 TaxID=857566 RepID=A0A1E3PT34_9ASCO|nr:stereospecific carbonyl reductase 2 [Nadsonia fulvescens var. elongata DSM 6958]
MSELKTVQTGLHPLPQPAPKLVDNVANLFSLKGKVASITGSSTGIGYILAEAFSQAGADVCIWYNSHPSEDKAEALAKKYGTKCKAYKCPINDPDMVEATFAQQVKDFGRIDICIVNAGVPWTAGPMIDAPGHKDWHKVIDLDFNGAYYCAKAIGKIFRDQHRNSKDKTAKGSLIFTASMSGHIVNVPQMQACYNAAKAGVIHFAKSLAIEWVEFARVNSISPGYIATEISDFIDKETKGKWWSLIPMGREGQPKELIGAYMYLSSDASTYTTGTDIIVDGGYNLS